VLFPDFQSIGLPFKVILLVPLNSVGHCAGKSRQKASESAAMSGPDWFVWLGVSYHAGIL